MSKASSTTLTMGTKQFVVHEAFETTTCFSGSKSSSFTPMTKVASASPDGAEMMTRFTEPPQVPGGVGPAGEAPRRLDDDVGSELVPGQLLGLALGHDPDALLAHQQVAALDVDRHRSRPWVES